MLPQKTLRDIKRITGTIWNIIAEDHPIRGIVIEEKPGFLEVRIHRVPDKPTKQHDPLENRIDNVTLKITPPADPSAKWKAEIDPLLGAGVGWNDPKDPVPPVENYNTYVRIQLQRRINASLGQKDPSQQIFYMDPETLSPNWDQIAVL